MTLLGPEERPLGDLAPGKRARQDRRNGRLKTRDQKDPTVRDLPHLLGGALSPLSDRMTEWTSRPPMSHFRTPALLCPGT